MGKEAQKKADYPNVDLSTSQQLRHAVQNIHNVYRLASPQAKASGRGWYGAVNEAVVKGVRRTSTDTLGGAGLVAAVSPNMDWDNHNIAALKELHSLKRADWASLQRGDRSPLTGMSISRATDDGLAKAHRIMEGEHVDTVLDRRTAPKTNAFAHNINLEDDVVTIDGRAHDIAANRLQPWTMDRGIGSASLKSGKRSRYEHFESAYRGAADVINQTEGGSLTPYQVQAVTWEAGKEIERSGLTKAGKPRKIGVARTGQPYA